MVADFWEPNHGYIFFMDCWIVSKEKKINFYRLKSKDVRYTIVADLKKSQKNYMVSYNLYMKTPTNVFLCISSYICMHKEKGLGVYNTSFLSLLLSLAKEGTKGQEWVCKEFYLSLYWSIKLGLSLSMY